MPVEVCPYILLTAFVPRFYTTGDWLKCRGARERCSESGVRIGPDAWSDLPHEARSLLVGGYGRSLSPCAATVARNGG